ncbi:MAG: FHA domain-containing protein [Myxococcota bacterium]
MEEPSDPKQGANTWIAETQSDAGQAIQELRMTVQNAVGQLARDLADRGRSRLPPVHEIEQDAQILLSTVRDGLEELVDGLETGLRERTAVLAEWTEPEALEARDAADQLFRELRTEEVRLGAYLAGWVEGGAVALTLQNQLRSGQHGDRVAYHAAIDRALAFFVPQLEETLSTWLTGLRNLVQRLTGRGTPVEPPNAPSTESSRIHRLERLAEKAKGLRVRVKNLPTRPSDRYLDRLEAQLAQFAEKRAQQMLANQARQARLKELMSFAGTLGVRAKGIPDNPSDAWLNRMEGKLAALAVNKGVAFPKGIRPPASDLGTTRDPAPARAHLPPLPGEPETVDPFAGESLDDDDWVLDMERKLAMALAERRETSDARREQDSQRQERLAKVLERGEQLEVDLGPVPDAPTEEWLDRAERQLDSAFTRSVEHTGINLDINTRELRLQAVIHAAEDALIDLGEIPDNPDDQWLVWAEAKVFDIHPVQLEADSAQRPDAYLVLHENTPQEQVWAVNEEELTIGRSRGNVVQIRDDNTVSRHHAVVAQQGRAFIVTDVGSRLGTFVDDERIDRQRVLRGGESIRLGETVLVFRRT